MKSFVTAEFHSIFLHAGRNIVLHLHEAKCFFKKFPLLRRRSCSCSFRGPYPDGNAPPKPAIALTLKLKNAARATRAAITLHDLTTTCT